MVSLSRPVAWLFGLVGVAFCAFTLWQLMSMLSTQTSPRLNEDLPCCGRYLSSLLWNIGLLTVFVIQHSGMSSDGWKQSLNRVGIGYIFHRPLYVICSCIVLHFVINYMARLPGPMLWYFDVEEYPTLWLAIFLLHCLMWFVICAGALGVRPMEFLGLQHSENSASKDEAHRGGEGMQSSHVGVVAFLVILWLHMAMSVDRFLLSVVWTIYVLCFHHTTPYVVEISQPQDKQK